ncbi:MAG: B12-binding domain-containing radical SAM protein [Rickettsiales bacterium]|jgi:radical SAM superfamily enzyme YgiQ (UPF0313 family)|nr:B12-binding domain-containing radical SAM protein [Rickettsiales bacterium]
MPEKFDILMIQPPVCKKQDTEHPVIAEYFKAVEDKLGALIGDSPYEINQGLKRIAEHVLHKNPNVKIKMLDLNFIDRDKRAAGRGYLTEEDIAAELSKYESKLTLISFMTQSFAEWSWPLVRAAKKISGNILLGGIQPSVAPLYAMQAHMPYISGVVIGEGEKVVSDLAADIDNLDSAIAENPLVYSPHISARGYFKEIHSQTRATTTQKEFAEEIPARYDLFGDYMDKISIRINTSWGCSNRCSFCSVGSFFDKCGNRRKTTDQVINEIRALDKLPLRKKQFVFGDLCMFDDMTLSNELLDRMIEINTPYEWWCQTRADKIDAALCAKMKKAGCRQVAIGCESGCDEQLRKISKGVSVATIKNSLKTIRDAGMETQCYWIIGLPGESLETARKSQDKIIEYLEQGLCSVPHISILVPYPGTPIYKAAMRTPNKSGIQIADYDFENYWMNCDMHGCGTAVHHTQDKDGNILLESGQIYDIWLETLRRVSRFANGK